MNSIDPHIQFTAETFKSGGSIPFQDALVSSGPDHTLLTTAYRKPTHTDQYLHQDSHHNLSALHSVCNTLTHRTRTVCTNQQLLHKEKEHIKGILQRCRHPNWALNRLNIKETTRTTPHRPITIAAATTTTSAAATTMATSIW